MSRATFAIVIGVLSCIAYLVLCGLGIAACVNLGTYEHKDQLQNYGTVMGLAVVSTLYCAIMFVISGILIIGVQKKRQELISPWVILGAIGIVYSVINFFITSFKLPVGQLIVSLVSIAISCLVWYPIYTLWRDMRKGTYNAPANQQRMQPQQYQPQQPGYYAPPPVYPAATADPGSQGDYTSVPQKA